MNEAGHREIPEFQGHLRKVMLNVPGCIRECSGIRIFGKRIKSLAFTTDVAIIRNCNADAVIAVYPFTPQPMITQAIMQASECPVFAGVGGGLTQGMRVVDLALHAEFQGAMGVVVNAPTSNETLRELNRRIDIPVVVTVVSEDDDIEARIQAGAKIFNVSAGTRCFHPQALPKYGHHRHRRPKRTNHPRNHRGGRKRHHMDAAYHGRNFKPHHGRLPKRRTI